MTTAGGQHEQSCECEHCDHFDGGPAHAYRATVGELTEVRTPYGTFRVCGPCVPDHHSGDYST